MPTENTSVLVVGGGLAGLSTAMLLAAQDVPTVVVERHPASSPHPRAIGYTPRSVEIFRTQGLDRRFPRAPGVVPHRVRVTSLAGEWFEEQPWNPPGTGADPGPQVEYSPCGGGGPPPGPAAPPPRRRGAGAAAARAGPRARRGRPDEHRAGLLHPGRRRGHRRRARAGGRVRGAGA